jgi:hypothetical protein
MVRKNKKKREENLRKRIKSLYTWERLIKNQARYAHYKDKIKDLIRKTQRKDIACYFDEGTVQIRKDLVDIFGTDKLPDGTPLVDFYLRRILMVLAIEQAWYRSLFYTDSSNKIQIADVNSTDVMRLTKEYYQPSVVLSKHQIQDPTSGALQINVTQFEQALITKKINLKLNPDLLKKIYSEALRILANKKEYNFSGSVTLQNLNVSIFFRSLAISKKILTFLKTCNVELRLVDFYREVVANPLLLFDVAQGALTTFNFITSKKEINELSVILKTFYEAPAWSGPFPCMVGSDHAGPSGRQAHQSFIINQFASQLLSQEQILLEQNMFDRDVLHFPPEAPLATIEKKPLTIKSPMISNEFHLEIVRADNAL